jgi:subtilisin family serine protease
MFDSSNNDSKNFINGLSGSFPIGNSSDLQGYGLDSDQVALGSGKNHASALHSDHLERDLGQKQFRSQGFKRSSNLSFKKSQQDLPTNSETDVLTGLDKGDPLVNRTKSISPRTVRTRYGSLNSNDSLNPTRRDRYKDDYNLDMREGGRVQINLNSNNFDAYLQIIDPRTGRVLAEDDDSGPGVNSQLTLTTQAGVDYTVRVTSFSRRATGDYTLITNTGVNPPNPTPTPSPSPTPNPGRFNSSYGYGLVDAASAVANVRGTSRFADVPDLGGNNWGNDLVKAPEVWARGFTGRNVTVAVVDTGVDHTHLDLDANIWTNSREVSGNGVDDDGNGFVDDMRGWNFVSNSNNAMDDQGHGTHVAGTIAGENNGTGVTGVAYDAKIMPVKVLNSRGSGSSESVAAGIRYAAANGADVINLSLGSDFPSSPIEQAVRYATEQGSVVVMASGNSAGAAPGYPARYATQYGISVGAVDRNRSLAYFSNRAGSDSRLQHVVAPGVNVYSTLPGNRYASYNGTSMATPHVAGVAALMLSANSNLTPEQTRQMITGSATGISSLSSVSLSADSFVAPLEQMPTFSELSAASLPQPSNGTVLYSVVNRDYSAIDASEITTAMFPVGNSVDLGDTALAGESSLINESLTVLDASQVTELASVDLWGNAMYETMPPSPDADALLPGELDELLLTRVR